MNPLGDTYISKENKSEIYSLTTCYYKYKINP